MTSAKYALAGIALAISMFFAWRSFYGMRISGAAASSTSSKSAAA
jgi:hypothetical protein